MSSNLTRTKRRLSGKDSTTTRIIEISRGKNGYGFTLSGQSPSFVSYVVRSSPADAIGLRVGDYVISVNGEDVSKSDHEDVVRLIGMSVGTLFLGVSQALEVAKSKEPLSPSKFKPPPGLVNSSAQETSQSKQQQPHFTQSFSRADKVLKDLYSGEIFKNMSSPSGGGGGYNAEKRSQPLEESSINPRLRRQISSSLPSMVMVQSVVAYLGTIEMPPMAGHLVAQASLDAVRGCVQRLRVEQHIHQRVLFKVTQSGVKMYNADGEMIALYDITKLKFSAACPDDNRFFCLVTIQDSGAIHHQSLASQIKTACHVFMVDPEISVHEMHKDKATRFGIHCSTNMETGDCVEFPKTPRSILSVVRLLQTTLNDQQQNLKARNEASFIANSTVDSGIAVDSSQDFSTPHYHVIDYHPHARLTRGESSLPPVILSWATNSDKRKISVERKHSSSSTEDGSRLSPRALFSSDTEASIQNLKSGSSVSSHSSTRSSTLPSGKALHHQKIHSNTPTSRMTQQVQPPTLSQQNLHRHDNNMKQHSNSDSSSHSHIPPPMHRLSMGKYRIADLRGYQDGNRHLKRTEISWWIGFVA